MLTILKTGRGGHGFLRKEAVKMKKKLYGYLACFVMLASFLDPVSSADAEHNSQNKANNVDYIKDLRLIDSDSIETIKRNKIYFIGDRRMEVDTAKTGWVVDLMYDKAQKETQKTR